MRRGLSNFVVCQVFIGVKFARDFYKKTATHLALDDGRNK